MSLGMNINSDRIFTVEVEVAEDIPANLDQFILLSRQGHVADAERFYEKFLADHKGWFAIVLEYALHLTRLRGPEDLEHFLEHVDVARYSPEERKVIRWMNAWACNKKQEFLSKRSLEGRDSNDSILSVPPDLSTSSVDYTTLTDEVVSLLEKQDPTELDVRTVSACLLTSSGAHTFQIICLTILLSWFYEQPFLDVAENDHRGINQLRVRIFDFIGDLIDYGLYWEAMGLIPIWHGPWAGNNALLRKLIASFDTDNNARLPSELKKQMDTIFEMDCRLFKARLLLTRCCECSGLKEQRGRNKLHDSSGRADLTYLDHLDDLLLLLNCEYRHVWADQPRQRLHFELLHKSAKAYRHLLQMSEQEFEKTPLTEQDVIITYDYETLVIEAKKAGYHTFVQEVDRIIAVIVSRRAPIWLRPQTFAVSQDIRSTSLFERGFISTNRPESLSSHDQIAKEFPPRLGLPSLYGGPNLDRSEVKSSASSPLALRAPFKPRSPFRRNRELAQLQLAMATSKTPHAQYEHV